MAEGKSTEGEIADGTRMAEAQCRQRLRDGQPRAAGDLGLLLFRAGRPDEAMPYLEQAVTSGDARAQYLLGVALFNGDHVAPDAARARLLLEAASAGGIAQAGVALKELANRRTSADPSLLVSAHAAGKIAAEFARLGAAQPTRPTLDSVAQDLLRPLLRERLEAMLPQAVRAGIDRHLATVAADQPKPVKS